MFGWGRRKDAQAVEAMREQLAAADMHARSVLSAVAQTDSRWSKDREDRARVRQSTDEALEQVRNSARENAADITRALHHVAEMCALVVERLEADRIERRALTEAINLLARQQSSPLETPSQVLGGTVLATSDTPRVTEIPRNGESSGNGEISRNGDTQRVDEISLAEYESEPVERIERYRPAEPVRPAEPFKAVEVVEPVGAAEVVRSGEAAGAWDSVPPPRPGQPVALIETPAPVTSEPWETVELVEAVEPAPAVAPPRSYDAFAGLPLLQPVEPVKVFEAVTPARTVEPEVPANGVPANGEAANGVPASGLDRHWSDSYRLTETSSFRPHGGTRLTPRRSTTRASTR